MKQFGRNTKIGAASGNTEESNIKKVKMDDELLEVARNLDISFGDQYIQLLLTICNIVKKKI